jgi:poly(hydroxyalkanoate) depolymerase family esterase
MNRVRALAATAVALAAAVTTAAHAAPKPKDAGSFTKHAFTTAAGSRDYWLYLPPGHSAAPRPLVVYLHGCIETATDTAASSHFNTIAAQRGFVVVYPQQNVTPNTSAPLADGNGAGCWNWFLPQDQSRGSGEPSILADLTRYVTQTQDIDPRRVYVEGVSAGADMAVILGAAYPDVYAAVAAIAGCAYATCADSGGTLAYQQMGPRARVVPMFIENGTGDTLNNMAMAGTLLSGWLGTDDLADDGAMNGSIARTPASVQSFDYQQTPQPGSGDACIHNESFPCPGGVVGFRQTYPYTVATYDDARGCDVLELWAVQLLEHAHPDAPGDGPFTDPLGPDVSAASYDFFSKHILGEKTGCGR